VYEHVKTIVTRYRRTVGTWTVISELHVNTNFAFSFEQVMDLTQICVMVVQKLQPSAKVVIEIDQPWGEYYAENPRSIPPMLYAEMVSQASVNPDLFGVRLEMGHPEPGRAARDLTAISALLDRYAALEKPLCISACSAPGEPLAEALNVKGLDPGYWRTPWGAEAQWRWMTGVVSVAMSKPYTHSICWHELYDPPRGPAWRGEGLINSGGQPRPALHRLAELRQAVREKRSPVELMGVTPRAPAS